MSRLCIGLTGGIGSGKSTVARLFAAQGAKIVDADEISHDLTRPHGAALTAIAANFGDEYIDGCGALERNRMRELVFSDPSALRRLEAILHPLIFKACIAAIDEADGSPYALLMAPLLLENPEFTRLTARVLLVDCEERHQIERVMLRSGLDENSIRAIIASQMQRHERQRLADDIIVNDGTQEALADQVFALHRRYLALAAQTPFDGG